MKSRILIVTAIALCALIIIGAIAVFASPDNSTRIDKIYNTAPASIITDEGLQEIKALFPNLCTNLKYRISSSSLDKSIEWLEYSSSEADFNLNSATRKVDMLLVKKLQENSGDRIESARAQELAINYINKYRPDIDISNMKQTGPGFVEYGSRKYFSFEWREYKDDVDIGHAITIELAPNGDLNGFAVAQSQYTDVDTKAKKFTYEQAVDIVKKYLQPIIQEERYNALKINKSKLAVFKGKVCWVINMASQPSESDPIEYYYFITIDAQSGKVLDDARG